MRATAKSDGAELREVLVLSTIALIPFARDLTIWSTADASNSAHLRVGLSAFHIPLVALLLLTLVDLTRCPRSPRGPWGRLLAITALWFGIAFAINPSWRGVDVLLHAAFAWAIWDTVAHARRQAQLRILAALVAFGVVQGALAILQRMATDGVAGVPLLEASGRALSARDGIYAVRGSFVHQYHLVGSVLVCTAAALILLEVGVRSSHKRVLMGSLLLFGAIVPMTYSRAAWLAVAPMLAVIVVYLRRNLLVAVGPWLVGLLTGALLNREAVVQRVSQSATAFTDRSHTPGRPVARSFDSGRWELFQQGIEQFERHPVTGVGPANYVSALRAELGVTSDPTALVEPPHNVVMQFAAEAGILGGLLTVALLGALALWAVRGGPLRVLAVMPLVPFFLLDLYTYTRQVGIVFSGVWLAVAQVAGCGGGVRRDAPTTTGSHRPSACLNDAPS